MLAERPYGARLRTFFPHLLDKAYARAAANLRWAALNHAIAIEIDLVPVGCLDETISRVRIEARYCS